MTDEKRAYVKQYEEHVSTWGPHCGAPKKVYEGHLRVLLVAHRKAVLAEKQTEAA